MMKKNEPLITSPLRKLLSPIPELSNDVYSKEKLENKKFLNFLNMIKENHSLMRTEDSQTILEMIRPKIHPLKNIEELKRLYIKCFLPEKKKNQVFLKPNEQKQLKWKFSHLTLLVWIICEYSFIHHMDVEIFEEVDWKFIASFFPRITYEQCRFKWHSIQKCVVQKDGWTKEEDEKLFTIVRKHKENYPNDKNLKWSKIAAELNKGKVKSTYRLGKHCRERWINHLDSNFTKGDWSLQDDIFILEKIKEFGKKWSQIAKQLKGRHENAVKNRYISIIKSLRKTDEKLNLEDINQVIVAFRENNAELESPSKKLKKENENQISFENPPVFDQMIQSSMSLSPNLPNNPILSPNLPNNPINDTIGSPSLDPKSFLDLKLSQMTDNSFEKRIEFLKKTNESSSLFILKSPQTVEVPLFKKTDEDITTHPSFPKINDPLFFPKLGNTTNPDIQILEIPNVYSKYLVESENSNKSSLEKKPEQPKKIDYFFQKENSIEFENLSQKMSSLSISDQLLVEANKILAEISSDHNIASISQLMSSNSSKEKSIQLKYHRELLEKKNPVLVKKIDEFNANHAFDINILFPKNEHITHSKTTDVDIFFNSQVEDKNFFSPMQSPGKKQKKKKQCLNN